MNIKEIIDRERWNFEKMMLPLRSGAAGLWHNASIDRIEAAVMERITELERTVNMTYSVQKKQAERITELERIIDEIHDTLYGQGFEIIGWHLNGATEPLDNFFESSNWWKDGDA